MVPIALPNGRDLGGTAVSGGTVRAGVLLRSANPADAAATAALEALGVATVVDLRTEQERQQQPAALPGSCRRVVADVLADAAASGAANVGALVAQALAGDRVPGADRGHDMRGLMVASYRDFATLGSGRRATGDLLRLLAAGDAPVLVHCTAGKDRTGWTVAVVLRLLGASDADITADYLASGPAVATLFEPYLAALPQPERAKDILAPLLRVESAYLDAAFEAADRRHGSFEAYLRDGLALDVETLAALRARLVEPTA